MTPPEGGKNFPGDYARLRLVVRALQLAVMLRQRSASLDELAVAMNVSTRTVRRDLIVLQAVPFPVTQEGDGRWRIDGPSPLLDGRR